MKDFQSSNIAIINLYFIIIFKKGVNKWSIKILCITMLYYSNFLNNFHYYTCVFQLLLEIFQVLKIIIMIFIFSYFNNRK